MKIESRFKDYYDRGALFGIDLERPYHRVTRTEELEVEETDSIVKHVLISIQRDLWVRRNLTPQEVTSIPKNDPWYSKHIDDIESYYILNPVVIVFCGTAYPAIQVLNYKFKSIKLEREDVFYNFESLDSFISKRIHKKEDSYFKFYKKNGNPKDYQGQSNRMILQIWFESFRPYSVPVDFHKKYNSPIVLFYKNFNQIIRTSHNQPIVRVIDPPLKDFNFWKMKTAEGTYQEIASYLGSVLLSPENELVQISDRSMLKKKGFAHPESFRKPKTKKH